MLILTRRIGESVFIGDEIRLTILGVRGTQVRIGINAPKDVPVHREEIYHRIQHEDDENPGNQAESIEDDAEDYDEDGPGDPHNV